MQFSKGVWLIRISLWKIVSPEWRRECVERLENNEKIDKYTEKWLCRGGRVAFRLIAIYSLLFFSIETKNKCNERLGTEVFI